MRTCTWALCILSLITLTHCALPKEKLSQNQLVASKEVMGDSIQLNIGNPLHCPVRVWVQSGDPILMDLLQAQNPLVLPALTDTVLLFMQEEAEAIDFGLKFRIGDPKKQITATEVGLPFPIGRRYTLVQGYQSTPSHNRDWSRYALDFSLAVGDTICAATDGYVVGVIEGYKRGGPDLKWRDYANFITLYDPQSGLFTQYVHLVFQGSLVQVGDLVARGQPIGISGLTGYTTIEHLHFNCLQPNDSEAGLKSMPLERIGPYETRKLVRNQWMEHAGVEE
ncbi:MAG: M23 family metallopeptidase [Bacteroidota bacterium]